MVAMAESSSGAVAAAKQSGDKRASCKFTSIGVKSGISRENVGLYEMLLCYNFMLLCMFADRQFRNLCRVSL